MDKGRISQPARHRSRAFVQKLSRCVPKLTLTTLREVKMLRKTLTPPLQQGMSTTLLYWNALVIVKRNTQIMQNTGQD